VPAPHRINNRDELAAHLLWLRVAVHDGHLDTRTILEVVVDALDALADMMPGPPVQDRPG
jgi:hypothetical protein